MQQSYLQLFAHNLLKTKIKIKKFLIYDNKKVFKFSYLLNDKIDEILVCTEI